jgi:uncharacterized membrane protein
MTLFIVGLVLFLGIHSVAIVAPAYRDARVARNDRAWKGLFSLIAIAGFALLIYGFGMARQTPVVLWNPPIYMRHLTLLLMLPVFPLLLAAYLPGRIKTAAKHPMLLAVKIWAFAHLLANGTLNDVILFAAFLAWAVIDRIAVKRRAVPLRRRTAQHLSSLAPGAGPSAQILGRQPGELDDHCRRCQSTGAPVSIAP